MKIGSIAAPFAGIFAMCLFMTGCQQPTTSTALAKATSKPSAVKKVEITIEAVKSSFSYTGSTSFDVKPDSQADVAIYWDGKRFTSKTDSGSTFMEFAPTASFEKNQTADFKIKKKVTVTYPNGSSSVTSSATVSVKRNVAKEIMK